MNYDRKIIMIDMKQLFTLFAAVSLLAACSEDVTSNRLDNKKQYISFSVIDEDANASNEQSHDISTRANAEWTVEQMSQTAIETQVVEVETDLPTKESLCLTITDEPFIRRTKTDISRGTLFNSSDASSLHFGVTEFLKNTNTSFFSNLVPVYQNVTLDGGRELFKANDFWEYDAYDGVEYDFYCYAPRVNGSGQGMTLSDYNRIISYDATNVEVGNQPDLMTARKVTSSYVGAIPLTFQHRLCAIQIKTSGTWTAGYHVSGVKFTNVISSGTFNIDSDKEEAWTSKGSPADYEVLGFTEAAATNTVITGSSDKWLMMVPQTLSNTKLYITLSDASSNSFTVVASINASTWRAGHTITYTVNPESISSMTVNYPLGSSRAWNDGGTAFAGPVSTYVTTDQFGLFVIDKENKIIISNKPTAPTLGSASSSRTLDIPIFKSKQYKYFLMYPYRSDLETIVGTANYNSYYKEGATVTGRIASADAFFANVVSSWTPASNQSTEANFKAQDLQIAALNGDHFDMVHKMGLAQITMSTSQVWKKYIYYVNQNSYGYSSDKVTVPASTNFATNLPYLYSSKYYFIVKGSATFSTSATGIRKWAGFTLSPAARALAKKTIMPTATYTSNNYYFQTRAYSFKNSVQTMAVTGNKKYFYEVWGACGGGYGAHRHPEGGYSCGYKTFASNTTIYIVTGGRGRCCSTVSSDTYSTYPDLIYHYVVSASSAESYNGGGKNLYYPTTGSAGASAGGATHIATASGLLSQLSSNRTSILLVAGGGGCNGGSYELIVPTSPYSVGGGTNGGDASYSKGDGSGTFITAQVGARGTSAGTGGAVKGTFGQGASANTYTMGSGGGGYIGGNSGVDNRCPGGGGSGYTGGLDSGTSCLNGNSTVPYPSGGTMHGNGYVPSNKLTSGNGYAMVSLCPIED